MSLVLTRNISQQIIIGDYKVIIRILNVYPDGRVKMGITSKESLSVELKEPRKHEPISTIDLYDFESRN